MKSPLVPKAKFDNLVVQELSDEITLKKSDKRYYLSVDNETLKKHFEAEEASLIEALRVLRL